MQLVDAETEFALEQSESRCCAREPPGRFWLRSRLRILVRVERFGPRARRLRQPPKQSAIEEILGAELSRDVLERMPHAVIARSPLAQEKERVERLELLLELADAL